MIKSPPRPFITTVDCYHIREEVGKTWAIYLVLIVVALTVARDGNSIGQFWLEFWLEKWLEIPF